MSLLIVSKLSGVYLFRSVMNVSDEIFASLLRENYQSTKQHIPEDCNLQISEVLFILIFFTVDM